MHSEFVLIFQVVDSSIHPGMQPVIVNCLTLRYRTSDPSALEDVLLRLGIAALNDWPDDRPIW